MPEAFIALNGPLFWGTVFLGIVLTALTRGTSLRNWALAFVDAVSGVAAAMGRSACPGAAARRLAGAKGQQESHRRSPRTHSARRRRAVPVHHSQGRAARAQTRLCSVFDRDRLFICRPAHRGSRPAIRKKGVCRPICIVHQLIVPFHMLTAPDPGLRRIRRDADRIEKPSPRTVLAGAERITTIC